jgi:hypothetical protein
VVRVCCRFHFFACCFFKKRPFVNFKCYLSLGRFFFFFLQSGNFKNTEPSSEPRASILFLFFTNIF